MKTINMNELLLAVYIFLFPGLNWLISPTIQYYIIAIIFLLHIIINKHNLTINKSLLYIVLILVVFLFGTYLFNKNVYLNDYAKKVVLYAILPMILFSKVKKFDSLRNYMGIIALIIFALSFSDPFDGYIKYGDYMSYGLFFALPSFILFHVNRKYYNKALYFIPELLILPGLLYSNRNSILTCLVGVFVLDLLLTSKSLKKIIKYFLIILICSLY